MLEHVIFSIDNVTSVHSRYKFLKHADNLRAMGKLKSSLIMCIGGWKGEMEQSFMCATVDYEAWFKPYTEGQEAILYVPGDVRQSCTLRYADGRVEVKKPMRKIDPWGKALPKAFTYREDTKEWWSCDDPCDDWSKGPTVDKKDKDNVDTR